MHRPAVLVNMPRVWPAYAFLPASLVAGGAVGYLDATLRAHTPTAWVVMLVALVGLFVGVLSMLQPRASGTEILIEAIVLLPLGLVVKDATALTLLGSSPATTDWYLRVIGNNLLGNRYFGVPGWYVLAAGWTVLMAIIPLKAWPGREAGEHGMALPVRSEALAEARAVEVTPVTPRQTAKGPSSSEP